MKTLILELFSKFFDEITHSWKAKIRNSMGEKLAEEYIDKFVSSSIKVFLTIIENGDYTKADHYLIETYNYFSRSKLSLLEVSQIFGQGRNSLLSIIDRNLEEKYDPIILIGFVDELIEQTFARYGMLHQEVQMKELTHDRNRLAAKLESNQQYLENILHSTDQAIMMVDKNEKFIAWNKGAEKLFGYTKDEIINKKSSFLLPDGKAYQEELEKIRSRTLENGYLEIHDTERKTKDGRVISVQLNVSKLKDALGNYSGRSVIIKDVTREKILQNQVDQSEKLAVIGQLAAGIAHEIGNPLASISAIVQILQRKSEHDFSKEQLILVKENIDRISKIVRELVDFSRPPGHEERLVSLSEVIRTALGIVRYDKRVKKVEFITDFDPELPKVIIVPDQLLQVYVNILINGIDAVNGEGTIHVRTYKDEENIYTDITDDGAGMDKLTMKKIFDPFYTTKEVGKGTGLGLSVSFGIVKKFNGDILVESKLNEGSKFTIKLPVKVD